MDSSASPFAQGLAAGVLRYQRCEACALALTGQRFACTGCGSTRLAWCDAAGLGTVYAVSAVHRAPTEAWRALAPYTLVLVDLDEGPRVMAHGAPGLAIGARVRAAPVVLAGQALIRFGAA
ncbi:MAG: OB-fold domain-containing protein [Pseudomonadota bacterium]